MNVCKKRKPVDGAIWVNTMYACQKCLYNSADRSHMLRHIIAKHHTTPHQATARIRTSYVCSKCQRAFTTKYNLTRHEHTCGHVRARPPKVGATHTSLRHRVAELEQQVADAGTTHTQLRHRVAELEQQVAALQAK